VSGPYGNLSVVPDMTDELVLVGAGIGVTPMISAFSDYLHKELTADGSVVPSHTSSKVCLYNLYTGQLLHSLHVQDALHDSVCQLVDGV
jgi:ferredoxin-NADP reductase